MERNGLSNFGGGLPKEQSCEIVSKSVHWFNRSHLSFFSICSRGSLTVSKNAMYENCIVDFLLNMCICHMCTINRQMVAVTI